MPDTSQSLHSLFAYRNAPTGDVDTMLAQLQPGFADHLQDLIQDQGDQGNTVGIGSGYRDNAKQAQLYAAALAKYGSPAVARLWVAPPGASNHNRGVAADLQYSSPQGMAAVRAAAPDYGLTFPLGNENWHIEPQGIRDPGATPSPPLQAMASLAPPPAKPGNEPMPIPSSAAPPIPPTAPPPSNPYAGLAAALGQTASQMTAPPPPPVPVAKPIAPKRDPAELARALTQGLAGNLTLA